MIVVEVRCVRAAHGITECQHDESNLLLLAVERHQPAVRVTRLRLELGLSVQLGYQRPRPREGPLPPGMALSFGLRPAAAKAGPASRINHNSVSRLTPI